MKVVAGLLCSLVIALLTCEAMAQMQTDFFKARGNDRCTILHTWTDGMQARYPGVDLYNSVVPSIEQAALASFFDEVFVPIFGKPLREFNDRDKRAVQDAINKCYPEASWQNMLGTGFETNPMRMNLQWRELVANIPASPQTSAASASVAPSGIPVSPNAPADATPYLVMYGRKTPLSQYLLSPCPELRTTDAYFAPDVYRAIEGGDSFDPRGVVDGERLDCALRDMEMGVADVESVAAEIFMRRLDGANIQRTEAVRAMYEGRFNPAWEDVVLAWRGLVRMDGNSLPAATIAAMQRDGRWQEGRPGRELVEPYVLSARPDAWQQTFGSYLQLPQGDYLRELFEALAVGSPAPAAALSQYAALRASGSYGQRMAVIERENAELRAAERAKAERYANMSEGEKIMAFLDDMMAPLDQEFDALDELEESMMDSGGVLYANSGQGDGRLRLCNESGHHLRLASLYLLRKRRDRFDPTVPTEYALRGWSELPVGQCAGIRVGANNIAFLSVQRLVGDGYVTYGSPSSEYLASDLDAIETRVLGVDFAMCVNPTGNFARTVQDTSTLQQCAGGEHLEEFNYAIQFGDRDKLTVGIK